MMKYRTALADHVLDLLDFIEEKIDEARTETASGGYVVCGLNSSVTSLARIVAG